MNVKYIYIISIFLTALLSGCAGTGGSHQLVGTPADSAQVAKYSDLLINVQPKNGINLSQADTDRMVKLIEEDIKAENPDRFKSINLSTPSQSILKADVVIKNYDEGSAFARSMLVGLGQIHIDADVTLSDALSKKNIAQHEVTKTFAWGGLYGAFTDIKDAEVGFCKAVAETILGKE